MLLTAANAAVSDCWGMADNPLTALLDRGVVVFDLEYTAWEGSVQRDWSLDHEHREIVQIGAVRLGAGTLDELDAMECLVRPTVNPVLSDYFTGLTSITNADLARDGIDLATGLSRLAALAEPDLTLVANGDDGAVVAENRELTGTPAPLARDRFVCVHDALMAALGTPAKLASSELPAFLGETMPGRAHTALADARAIALTLRSLRRRGVV